MVCHPATATSNNPIYTIMVDDRRHCEGIAVSPFLIATVKHCVFKQYAKEPLPADRIEVQNSLGQLTSVSEVHVLSHRYDSLADLQGADFALLQITKPVGAYAAVGETELNQELQVALRTNNQILKKEVAILFLDGGNIFTQAVTCIGDSGSPLLDKKNQVIGLASWRTEPSCSSGYSIFTRLDQYRDWIQQLALRIAD